MADETSFSATRWALSSSTIPVHRQCPMLDVRESIGRLSASSPTAYHPFSSNQKSRLNAAFSWVALARKRSYVAESPTSKAKWAVARYAPYV